MLHRLSKKTSALGLSDRIRSIQTDLNEGWPHLETSDLLWAAASLHHMADPDRVLAGAFDNLRPGGLLAVTEMDFFPRFLPDDIGVGRPGLEARVHAALNPGPSVDWTEHVARAGFVLEAKRPFVVDLPAPLPAATARYAQVCLRKLRSHLDGQLPADDLAALLAVLDSDGPHSVLRRDDLTVRTTRTTWAARRPTTPGGWRQGHPHHIQAPTAHPAGPAHFIRSAGSSADVAADRAVSAAGSGAAGSGADAARARGRVGGHPPALTSEQIADARILLSAGQTRIAVAAKLRVSRWTLSRALDTAPR
ncbi:helix-turn-helix domain-containing protein [Nonomuraea guangzhouensis]|uniref:Helix-turn-helix domain-containing protein n=1 Tax=Nonomuraea guangzhouensis TaxID=1291555 RepID=A0ABW4GQG9_9ACTN|nr:helix-turn-helix domain-containing protein [Nonomuraea guangzhouensis]